MFYFHFFWKNSSGRNLNPEETFKKRSAHLKGRRTMATVWVERQRKAVLFCPDTEEQRQKCVLTDQKNEHDKV